MKDLIFKTSKWATIILALFAVTFTTSCGDDDTIDPIDTPVEDGIYIKGDATAFTDFDIKATMASTRNEVLQEDRPELLELYIAVKGSGTFSIVNVAGDTQTSFGPGADFADVVGVDGTDDPQVTWQLGSYEESATGFSVPSDGLYHVVMDTELKKVVIIPVKHWGLIGAATPGGWSSDTKLEAKAFGLESMTFEATDVEMTVSEFKFRYSSGWKVVIDADYDNGEGVDPGIKVNTNFGGTFDALVPGGDNMNNTESGVYTATMVWTAGAPQVATMTRTGDLPAFDYTNTELGLVGDALTVDGATWNWDNGHQLQTPVVAGSKFTWTFTSITTNTYGGGFKIREGANWDGLSFGFNDVVMSGDGVSEFVDNNGNIDPTVDGGVYDLTFAIDNISEEQTLSIVKQ